MNDFPANDKKIPDLERLKNAAKVSTKFTSFTRIGLVAIYPILDNDKRNESELQTFRALLDHNVISSQLNDFLGIRSEGLAEFALSVLERTPKLNDVIGNLGALEYIPLEGPTWGRKIVGASKNAVDWLKGTGFAQASFPPGFEVYEAEENKKNDSEYLLLTALTHHFMELELEPETAVGQVILITEALPCNSCVRVIQQFRKQYPNISMTIAFAVLSVPDAKYSREEKLAASLNMDYKNDKLLRLEVTQKNAKQECLRWNRVAPVASSPIGE